MEEDPEKIVEITDQAWTAEFTLRRILDCADAIEDIAIVMKLKDGTLDTATSIMKPETFAILCKRLELRLDEFLLGYE